jgi:hypothetical protein
MNHAREYSTPEQLQLLHTLVLLSVFCSLFCHAVYFQVLPSLDPSRRFICLCQSSVYNLSTDYPYRVASNDEICICVCITCVCVCMCLIRLWEKSLIREKRSFGSNKILLASCLQNYWVGQLSDKFISYLCMCMKEKESHDYCHILFTCKANIQLEKLSNMIYDSNGKQKPLYHYFIDA